ESGYDSATGRRLHGRKLVGQRGGGAEGRRRPPQLPCLTYNSPPFSRNSAAFSAIPCAISRRSWVIRIEQNLGPHIAQKCASLAPSAGRVSSWKLRAVSGSSARLN